MKISLKFVRRCSIKNDPAVELAAFLGINLDKNITAGNGKMPSMMESIYSPSREEWFKFKTWFTCYC